MTEESAQERVTRAVEALWCVAAVGALVVLAVRVSSWSSCWRLAITEGREAPAIYAIWRVLHGHPLYESPLEPPYSVTLYNFGFYRVYAAVLQAFGVDGENLLAWPRLLTALGAVLGSVLFVRVAASLARPVDRLGWAALAALAFTTWFGTQFTSWWVLGVRPDIWALALALLGLNFVLVGRESHRSLRLVLASLAFFAAWSFKQSTVWTFAGTMLALTLARDFRALALLGVPCVGLMGFSLGLGGAAYRLNLIEAPAASAFSLRLLLEVASRALPQNLGIFSLFLLAPWARGVGLRAAYGEGTPARRAVVVVAFVATVFGTLALGREGSNKNHLLEGYVTCALAAWGALVDLRRTESLRLAPMFAGIALFVPYALMPWVQFGRPNANGRIVLCSTEDARELTRFSDAVSHLPKPLYSDDEIQSLPWHSSDNRYPALVLDGTWYGIARRERLLGADFPFDLLGSGRFRSALFLAGHPDLIPLEKRGASCAPLAPVPFGLHFVACSLRAPGSSPP